MNSGSKCAAGASASTGRRLAAGPVTFPRVMVAHRIPRPSSGGNLPCHDLGRGKVT